LAIGIGGQGQRYIQKPIYPSRRVNHSAFIAVWRNWIEERIRCGELTEAGYRVVCGMPSGSILRETKDRRIAATGLRISIHWLGSAMVKEKWMIAQDVPQPVRGPNIPDDLNDPRFFVGREMSMLEFQRRVMEEAQDPANPLLERVKFISIVSSNLSEFFMVRVAGLKQQIEAGVPELSLDGRTPAEQLAMIRPVALQLMRDTRKCLRDLVPLLGQAGIHILDYDELDDKQKAGVKAYFDTMVFPVLTPLAFDLGHPFPHISNLCLNLAVVIRDPLDQEHYARIKVPNTLPRLVPVNLQPGEGGVVAREQCLVWLEQVIAAHLGSLFPGMTIVEAYPFRVTRDAEMLIQQLEAPDLLETVEEGVLRRRFGSVVRVTVTEAMPAHIRNLLIDKLDIEPADVFTLEPPLGMSDVVNLQSLDDYRTLKDPPFTPSVPPVIEAYEGDIFAAIRQQDILLHHPYDSFTPVVDFIHTAACDPDVLAIKQTLYRIGKNSPIVDGLLEAARNGKQVAVLMELKARFDEESNVEWARALEHEGVHVVYGLLGLKTHSKIALVVRKEGDHIRHYGHRSTGNYNASTAQLYTDLGLFTCDPDIGADASDMFNYLTGYSAKQDYRKLLVAPINMRRRMEALIQAEIEHQQRGEPGRLIFKLNSLVDKFIIQGLYRASQAGVRVDLIVRGMCCLLPGLPGISENIHVTSIVGRFLEHSRIYYCRNGGAEEIYLGSADLMERNLDRRVEILFPILDKRIIRYLRDDVLEIYLADNVKARRMLPDGTYQRARPGPDDPPFDSQQWLISHRPQAGAPPSI
jgi:polyphosphate kinase